MKRNPRTIPALEQLEDRCVPAMVRFVAGILIVRSTFGESLNITQTAANRFMVNGAPGVFNGFAFV